MVCIRNWKVKASCTLVFVIALSAVSVCAIANRSFVVDYPNDRFLKDGKPFWYVSGSIHYSRIPAFYWRDRLDKAYAAGLDAVQFYIPWNFHELEPGKYDFKGDRDVESYLQQIQDAGLLAIVRLGPYICGEWDFGGLPPWLIRYNRSMSVRSSDPVYLAYVSTWFSEMLNRIERFIYSRGGPIIMMQIENEYSEFPTCDHAYLRFLYTLVRHKFGDEMVIFTTDGCSSSNLRCGSVTDPDAFALLTVDFELGRDPAGCFAKQRANIPGGHGPAVNSEFYTGWLDNWGNKHSRVDANQFTDGLNKLLSVNVTASVNMYMFAGGSNFGFYNGANSPPYSPQVTSYDYDAPISEAGDTTWKYYQIRATIAKYKPLPNVSIPANTTKAAYGRISLPHSITLSAYIASGEAAATALHSQYPLSYEQLGIAFGFMVYASNAPAGSTYPAGTLLLDGVHDRAYVFDSSDWSLLGIVYRGQTPGKPPVTRLKIPAVRGVYILVEAFGRINFGGDMIGDGKGIVSNVTLVPLATASGDAGPVTLSNWTMYPLSLEKIIQAFENRLNRGGTQQSESETGIANPQKEDSVMHATISGSGSGNGRGFVPTFYTNDPPTFSIQGEAHDTFARIDGGWRKGQLLVNGRNLGRYWPVVGPQVTLFVPSVALNSNGVSNSVWLFELEGSPCATGSSTLSGGKQSKPLRVQLEGGTSDCSFEFIDKPILDGPV